MTARPDQRGRPVGHRGLAGTPVAVAAQAFGGKVALGVVLQVSKDSVYRWNRPRGRRGCCGGDFPTIQMVRMTLKASKERGLPLTLDDLVFGRPDNTRES